MPLRSVLLPLSTKIEEAKSAVLDAIVARIEAEKAKAA